jgi:two-component system chemotaxis response regulator CheB
MGGSAGGVAALGVILAALPPAYELPVLVVQHLHPSDEGAFARHLSHATRLPVVEPCDKARIERGHVYTAPANYHMLVERDETIGLSVDERVNWSRPSIDVLFESAARAWGGEVTAVILSGANADGARGMRAVRQAGGLTIAQDPGTAESPTMPQAAIDAAAAAEVLAPEEIGRLLAGLGATSGEGPAMPRGIRSQA